VKSLVAFSFFAMLAVAGCSTGETVIVEPTGTVPIQDNFFVTWEISSAAFGPIDCFSVGASSVDMDIVDVDTGERFVYSFACEDYQGTSGPVGVGTFNVLLNLSDAGGGVISQVDVGVSNVTTAGTIDLGHVVFQVD
jgi:hypothetical protein